MGDKKDDTEDKTSVARWSFYATIIASLIGGIISLIVADKIPSFRPSTPTPEVLVINPGTILLDENFEDRQMQGMSINGDWKIIADETKNQVINSDSPNGGNFIGFGSEAWGNYLFEFRIRFLSTNNQGIGLEFRRTCDNAQNCFRYVLILSRDSINLYFDSPESPYTPIQASSYDFNTQSWQDVRIEAKNSNIKIFINTKSKKVINHFKIILYSLI